MPGPDDSMHLTQAHPGKSYGELNHYTTNFLSNHSDTFPSPVIVDLGYSKHIGMPTLPEKGHLGVHLSMHSKGTWAVVLKGRGKRKQMVTHSVFSQLKRALSSVCSQGQFRHVYMLYK